MKSFHAIFIVWLWALLLVVIPAKAEWTGQGDLSALYTNGNSNAFSGGLGVSVGYSKDRLVLKLGADGTYGKVKYQDGDWFVNTNKWRLFGGVEYYFSDAKRLFAWYDLDFWGHQYKGFWIRVGNSGGLGYSLSNRKNLKWKFKLGGDYTWEHLVNLNEDGDDSVHSVGSVASTDFEYNIRKGIDWTWNFRYLPDLENKDAYRMDGGSALTVQLTQTLSLKQSVNFQYENAPGVVARLDPFGGPVRIYPLLIPAKRLDISAGLSIVMSFRF